MHFSLRIFTILVFLSACGPIEEPSKCDEDESKSASLLADESKDECKSASETASKDNDGKDSEKQQEQAADDSDKGESVKAAPFPDPFKKQKDVSETGTGDAVVDIDISAGALAFRATHDGERHFSVKLLDKDGEWVELLANTTGAATIYNLAEVEYSGPHMLEISADGEWHVETFKPDLLDKMPASLKGEGTYVSAAFPLKAEQKLKLTANHDGKRHFSITLINAKTGGFAALGPNKTGAYSGQTMIQADEAGYYMLLIDADGSWDASLKSL